MPLQTATPPTKIPSPPTSTSSRPSHIDLFPSVSPQTEELIALAAALRISNEPMSQTVTVQAQVGTIDPITGHMFTEDDIAVNRAIGPDRADPPSNPPSNWCSSRPYGGGLPSGGPPRGGFPGGPPGGGGNGGPPGGGGGGSPGANIAQLPGQDRGSDK